MKLGKKETELLELVKSNKQSPSHDEDHMMRVAKFGAQLASMYGGNADIVTAAAILHDTARVDSNYRGQESAKAAADSARDVLAEAGYNKGEVEKIVQCIAEHDQPDFHSSLLESRMLKDADYLDGFGARGVLRSIMYTVETGAGIATAVKRIQDKGKVRLEGMEFAASKRYGWQLYRFSQFFLSELGRVGDLTQYDYSGKLIVMEGISGCGKDTQAELLAEYIKRNGKKAIVVHHPTKLLKELWRIWKVEVDDRGSEMFMLMADRLRKTREEILPALRDGKVVISTRSSISAQVYQENQDFSEEFMRFAFSFEPYMDLILYLDVDVDIAYKRTGKRVTQGVEQDRGFFGSKQTKQKKRYIQVLKGYPDTHVVDANGKIKQVQLQIQKIVDNTMDLN